MSDETKVASHMSDDRLLAFLDGELAGAERALVSEHLAACAACAAELDSLRWATRRLSAALERIDRPAPERSLVAVAGYRRSRGARRWALGSLAKAAVLLLIVGGASAAAIPGSPVREWIAGTVERLLGPEIPVVETTPDVTGTVSDVSGVTVALLNGRVTIRLLDLAPQTEVRVLLVDAAEATVWTAGARYRTAPGRIEVVGGGAGEVRVEIPRAAAAASLELDGELVLSKDGDRLQLLAPAADSSRSELLFRVGG